MVLRRFVSLLGEDGRMSRGCNVAGRHDTLWKEEILTTVVLSRNFLSRPDQQRCYYNNKDDDDHSRHCHNYSSQWQSCPKSPLGSHAHAREMEFTSNDHVDRVTYMAERTWKREISLYLCDVQGSNLSLILVIFAGNQLHAAGSVGGQVAGWRSRWMPCLWKSGLSLFLKE